MLYLNERTEPSLQDLDFIEYKRRRNRVIAICVAAYAISYLCRTNLSLALNDIIGMLGISRAQAGMISTMHFWAYAGGQLLAGFLCTKIDPKYVAAAGMLMTAACNGLIGFCSGYGPIVALWALNGLSLALFWPPILQISINWVTPKEYAAVSILLNLPTTVGYLLTWSTLGTVRTIIGWRWLFFIPSLAALAFLAFWLFKLEAHAPAQYADFLGSGAPARPAKAGTETGSGPSLWKTLLSASLLCFAAVVIAQGAIKESINLWAPTLLGDQATGSFAPLASAFTTLIPLFSTVGLLFTAWLTHHYKDSCNGPMVCLLLLGLAAGWSMMAMEGRILGLVICLGLLLAVVYGVNTILTTLLPLQFSKSGNSALLSSIFNFLSYTGAALGGMISGAACDVWGWHSVYVLWAGLASLSALILISYVLVETLSVRRKTAVAAR